MLELIPILLKVMRKLEQTVKHHEFQVTSKAQTSHFRRNKVTVVLCDKHLLLYMLVQHLVVAIPTKLQLH